MRTRLTTCSILCALVAACGGDGISTESDTDGGDASADVVDATPDTDARGDATADIIERDAPRVDEIRPSSGPVAGRQRVAILGANFFAPCDVAFGDLPAVRATVVNDRALDLSTPPAASGATVDLTVTCAGGAGTLEQAYEFVGDVVPEVLDFEPKFGRAAGGDVVRFAGTDLDIGGRTLVRFGDDFARGVAVAAADELGCTTPEASPGPVSVSVELADFRFDLDEQFVFVRPLTASAIEPGAGARAGGSVVTIVRTDLVEFAAISVAFGDEVADPDTFAFADDGATLVVEAPASEEQGLVDVTVSGLLAEVVLEDGFAYVDPISVDSMDPDAVPTVGTNRVTIRGADFEAGADPLTVFVGHPDDGGTEAFDVTRESDTEVSFLVPPVAPARYAVWLRHGFELVEVPEPLDVFAPISVTEIDPASGPVAGGTRVAIDGAGFVDGVIVRFGAALGTDVAVDAGGDALSVTTPAGAAGIVDVSVQSPFSSDTIDDGFEYVAD